MADIKKGSTIGGQPIPVRDGSVQTNLNAEKVNGVKLTVGATAPSTPNTNDIWIDTN